MDSLSTSDRILEYIRSCGHSPTVREIADAVGLSSPSTVYVHLYGLEKRGLIERRGRERRIVVKEAA